MEFLYFFGDRVEVLEDEVGGGSGGLAVGDLFDASPVVSQCTVLG